MDVSIQTFKLLLAVASLKCCVCNLASGWRIDMPFRASLELYTVTLMQVTVHVTEMSHDHGICTPDLGVLQSRQSNRICTQIGGTSQLLVH